jgi:hypothetical protein
MERNAHDATSSTGRPRARVPPAGPTSGWLAGNLDRTPRPARGQRSHLTGFLSLAENQTAHLVARSEELRHFLEGNAIREGRVPGPNPQKFSGSYPGRQREILTEPPPSFKRLKGVKRCHSIRARSIRSTVG